MRSGQIELAEAILHDQGHILWRSQLHENDKRFFRNLAHRFGFDVVDLLLTMVSLISGNRMFPAPCLDLCSDMRSVIFGEFVSLLWSYDAIAGTLCHIAMSRGYAFWSTPEFRRLKHEMGEICYRHAIDEEDILLTLLSVEKGEGIYMVVPRRPHICRYTFGSGERITLDLEDESTWDTYI